MNFSNRIIFVFVFGWFFRPNIICILLTFLDQIILITKWFFKQTQKVYFSSDDSEEQRLSLQVPKVALCMLCTCLCCFPGLCLWRKNSIWLTLLSFRGQSLPEERKMNAPLTLHCCANTKKYYLCSVIFRKSNNIRIRIWSILEGQIIFVFVFGHFWKAE